AHSRAFQKHPACAAYGSDTREKVVEILCARSGGFRHAGEFVDDGSSRSAAAFGRGFAGRPAGRRPAASAGRLPGEAGAAGGASVAYGRTYFTAAKNCRRPFWATCPPPRTTTDRATTDCRRVAAHVVRHRDCRAGVPGP